MYPAIPLPPDREPNEPAIQYGSRVLCYILREQTTAACTDEQLELAAHAGQYASAARDCLPAYYEAIREARVRIALTLRARQEEATTLRPTPAPIDSRPDVGPMAPLQPAPLTRPPCGSYADQPVTIRF